MYIKELYRLAIYLCLLDNFIIIMQLILIKGLRYGIHFFSFTIFKKDFICYNLFQLYSCRFLIFSINMKK